MSDLDCSVLLTDSTFAQSSLNSSNSTISTTHAHSYHTDTTHTDTDQKIATQQTSSTNQTPNSSTPSSLTPTSSGLAEIDGAKDSALRSTLKHLSQQLNVFTFSPLAIDTRSDSSGCTPTPPPSVVSAFRANFLSSNGNHLDESPLSPHNFGHPSSVLHSVFAPSPSNAPFVLSDHFLDERVLSKTIFGQLSLATDLKTGMKVVIKASEQAKMTKRHKGAEIQEDVKKEAIVMRTLGLQKDLATRQPQLAACHIDLSTCGLSDKYIRENSSSTDSNTLTSSTLSAIASGRQFLASLIGEYQTPTSHFLATEYATRGDLYSVLTEAQAAGQPLQGEKQARIWFKQLCEGVRYLHALSTAHMDLSVENVCIDSCGNVKIIDLGLAARHPHAHAVTFGSASDTVVNSCHLMSEENDSHFSVGCRCAACWSSHQQLEDRVKDQIHATIKRFPKRVERIIEQSSIKPNLSIHTDDDAIPPSPTHRLDRAESDKNADPSEILASSCKFLFRPVCRQYCKPGKMSYMSIELTDPREFHQPFDGYKADSFSLGVILFILCTGVPPFLKANEYHDTWFRWFITSEWMERRRYTTPVAKHYTQLSPNCWDLIDSIFKPQHIRPSIDEILAHPWFDDQHPLSQPIDRLAKSN